MGCVSEDLTMSWIAVKLLPHLLMTTTNKTNFLCAKICKITPKRAEIPF
jgi:hypothetical protein